MSSHYTLCVLTDCAAVTLTDDTAEGVDPAQFRVFRLNKLRALFDDDAVLRWIDGLSDDDVAYFYDLVTMGKGEKIKDAFRVQVERVRMREGAVAREGMIS